MKRFGRNDFLLTLLAFVASALMLTVIQVPFRLGFLAWICMVPFILVSSPKAPAWRLVWMSYLVSSVYWLANLYWVSLVTVPGQVLLSLSLGLYWPVLSLAVRYCRKKKAVVLFVMVPILLVGAEAWQGIIYTGFNWRLLAHSQWANLRVIQIVDIFGALGVSLLIAAVNGLAAGLVIDAASKSGSGLFRTANIVKVAITAGLVAATLVYGTKRINETPDHLEPGPMVGSVQSNIPSQVKELAEAGEMILEEVLNLSNACIDAGAELIAWPETIVAASLNKSYLGLCQEGTMPVIFDRVISAHTMDRVYVLLGAHAVDVVFHDDEPVVLDRYNSAYFYRPDGSGSDKRYDKIHLVPYGEYIPMKDTFPLIYDLAMKLSPYDYDYHLTKGTEYTRFMMRSGDRAFGFGCLICYEDTDPDVTRKMVVDETGEKQADWLVNISNDGWYVKYEDGKVLPSAELSQRTAISVFRAIENRVSILRSVNTGISCLIDSTGMLRDGFAGGDLPDAVMARQGMAGWFVDRIDVDDRVTFFSTHGQLIAICCRALFVIAIVFTIADLFRKNRREAI